MESYHLAWLLCFLMILMTIVSLYIYCLKRGCCDDCPCHQQGTDDIDFAKYPLKATHYTATSPNNNFSLATNGRVSNGHFNPPSVATASVGTKTAPDLEHQQLNDSTNKLQKKHDPFVEAYLNYYSTISNVYRDHELDDAAATLNQHRNSHHLRAKSLTLTDPPKRKRYRNGDRSAYTGTISDTEMTRKVVPMERSQPPTHSNLKKTPKSDRLRSSLTHLAAGHHYRPGARVVTFVDEAKWRKKEESDYPSGFHSDSSPFTDKQSKNKPRPYNIPIVKPNSMSAVATKATSDTIHGSDQDNSNCQRGVTASQNIYKNASSGTSSRNGNLSDPSKESPTNPSFRIIQRDNTKFRIITTPASISCHNTVV